MNPEELVIAEGDTAVMVGSPNPKRVHKFANLTGPDGSVLFIEPEPNNFNSLKDAGSNYDHVAIDRVGAWSESDKKELLLGDASNPGDHKIPVKNIEHDNDYRPENYNESIEIQVAPLDNILKENNITPDFIEIAVNGAELEILKGATNTISSAKPMLFVKGHPRNKDTEEPINKQIAEFLRKQGYKTIIGASKMQTVGETKDWDERSGDVFAWSES
jgi:FkbM family methyltransferase